MDKPINTTDIYKEIIGDPCEIKSLEECKQLCKELGFTRRDKFKITSMSNFKPGFTTLRSHHRHHIAFAWAEPSPKSEGVVDVYGMRRILERQIVDIVWARCNSQRWFLRFTIGMLTNKVLEIHHSANGRVFNKSWNDLFAYTFKEDDFDGMREPETVFITKDMYLYRVPKGAHIDRKLIKELKTYRNIKNYEKLQDL